MKTIYSGVVNKFKEVEGGVLIRSSFWNLSGSILSKLIMLVTSILTAHYLGPYAFGQWGVIRSTSAVFTTFLSFGVGVTAMKHLAEFRTINQPRASRIFSISLFASIIFGIIISVVMFLLSETLAITVLKDQDIALPLKITSSYLIVNSISGVLAGALMGLDAYKKLALANLFTAIFTAPIIILSAQHYNVVGISYAYLSYYVISIISYIPPLKSEFNKYKLHITFHKLRSELSIIYKFSLPAMVSGAIGGPVIWIANIIVARMTNGYTIIGVFNAAKIAQNAICEIGNQLHNPLITLISNTKSNKANILSYTIPLIFISIFILPILFIPELVIWTFAKSEFINHNFNMIVSLTMITGYITIFKQSFGRAIIINNKVWWGVYENIFWSILLLAMIYPLTNVLGVIGLALSFALAYILDLFSIFPFYKRAGLVPNYILKSTTSYLLWFTVFIAPLLIYFDVLVFYRIAALLVSALIHYFYLKQFKNK